MRDAEHGRNDADWGWSRKIGKGSLPGEAVLGVMQECVRSQAEATTSGCRIPVDPRGPVVWTLVPHGLTGLQGQRKALGNLENSGRNEHPLGKAKGKPSRGGEQGQLPSSSCSSSLGEDGKVKARPAM